MTLPKDFIRNMHATGSSQMALAGSPDSEMPRNLSPAPAGVFWGDIASAIKALTRTWFCASVFLCLVVAVYWNDEVGHAAAVVLVVIWLGLALYASIACHVLLYRFFRDCRAEEASNTEPKTQL